MPPSNSTEGGEMRFQLIAMLVAALAAASIAGCGGGDDDTSAATAATENATSTTAGATAAGRHLEIKMGDYFFSPAAATAKAGKTVIEAPNEGSVEHELVVFRTNMDPAKLPTESGGGVDEEKLDEVAEEAGEVADVEAGETKSGSFDLKPGSYVIFCNIPGHYAQGMYGTLTVGK
jgi:uncharacterized cupredoxin-like copper-binding protein